MTRLDGEQDVIRMASELGLDWRDPVGEIVNFCLGKIKGWLAKLDDAPTLSRLEELVCEKLKLLFEEVWSDDDLDEIIKRYVALRDPVFARLRHDLDDSTFAALLERRGITATEAHRYVAVVDCRGEKANRRFFTRWHEIAHLLTLTRQLELPFHRSTIGRCPIERLMDIIAGKIGFYAPIFRPAVISEIETSGHLSFSGVERVRSTMCPSASFQATLIACVERAPVPLIYVEAAMGYKKAERAELASNQLDLFPMEKPKAKLRAAVSVGNEPAKSSSLRVDQNMQVPEESVIARHYFATEGQETTTDAAGTENLAIWRHSDGTSVGTADIHLEARRHGDRVVALVRPAEQRKSMQNVSSEE